MEALRKYLEQYNDRATWEAFCGEAVVAEEALALLQQAEEEQKRDNDEISSLMNDVAHLKMKITEWYKLIGSQLYDDAWLQTTMVKLCEEMKREAEE